MKVKICGITNLEDALTASFLGADALGFIFTPKSPRMISKQKADKIIGRLDPFVTKVGVFLDSKKEEVLDTASFLRLDVLQFHGRESSSYCDFFKPRFKVIKVFFPRDDSCSADVCRYNVDAFLFDVNFKDKQNGNKRIPRKSLGELSSFIKEGKRVIISGGLNPENVSGLKKLSPYAVDVASGVEKMAGVKDKNLVEAFIKNAK